MPPDPRSSLSIKRTNVRFSSGPRWALWLASGVAPRAVERWGLRRFSTVRGPRAAAPPGGAAHVFRLEARGYRLQVWEWGSGAETVVLAHGWNGHAAQMERFAAPLVARGMHVVAFDQPAHGRSAGTTATLGDFRDALLEVERRLAPVAAVVAHSLGATAAVLALGLGLRVPRAVLLAPPTDLEHYLTRFGARSGLPPARVRGMADQVRRALGGTTSAVEAARAAPGRTELLIVHDADDREVPLAQGRALADAHPRARLLTTRRLGHDGLLSDTGLIGNAAAFAAGRTIAAVADAAPDTRAATPHDPAVVARDATAKGPVAQHGPHAADAMYAKP